LVEGRNGAGCLVLYESCAEGMYIVCIFEGGIVVMRGWGGGGGGRGGSTFFSFFREGESFFFARFL
jgi:hypothetical protein